MTDQRTKRQEITMLKEQLAKQTTEIDRIRADENRALIEISTSREKMERLENKLKMAEFELDDLRSAADRANPTDTTRRQSTMTRFMELEQKLHLLQKENENFRQSCDRLHATIKELEDERDRIDEKYRDAIRARDELRARYDARGKECVEHQTTIKHLESSLQSCEEKCSSLMRTLEHRNIEEGNSHSVFN